MKGNSMNSETIGAAMKKQFIEVYGVKPVKFVRAPGRVNLIGEHTDYNGYPVMPIAIPFTISIAAAPREDRQVRISNTDPIFQAASFDLSPDIPHSDTGQWANYVKAAANELCSRSDLDLYGMNALFSGDIPNSAGLSSSSALVIASALALLAVNDIRMDKTELAEMMARGEHYVGTQGGGMDQAICLLGRQGKAVKLDFFPLRHTYAPFPDNHSIVVAHSLVRAAKTENALLLYNRRPAECRLATAIINTRYNAGPPLSRLGDLPGHAFFTAFANPVDFVNETFDKSSYTLDEVANLTGENAESLTSKYLMTRSGVPMPSPPEGFLIRQRALHVLTEAKRVEESAKALGCGDARMFGKLMNESHRSCDEQYGISTPELNRLTEIMRSNGALGARLTGAGFGGCAIGLVRDENVESLLDGVREEYYNTFIKENHPELLKTVSSPESLMFTVKPSDGAYTRQL